MLRNTITVLITGAAGNLSNQFIPLLCSGKYFFKILFLKLILLKPKILKFFDLFKKKSVFGDKVEINLNLYDL